MQKPAVELPKKVGKYTLTEELGRGQFGIVFRAKENASGQIYAVKCIAKAQLNSMPKLKELFQTEKKVMRELFHPNIMHLYDEMETGANYYLVIDYCGGGDLEELLKREKTFLEIDAVYYLKQIMNGFVELHKHNIMHRDFKLANIFLDQDQDQLKIGDFGFAKEGVQTTMTKLGTPITTAPEIQTTSSKTKYTNKADLWSIGVTFYYMLFGKYPWKARSTSELLSNIVNQSGTNLYIPDEPKITDECRNLLIQLIEPNPDKRINWNDFFNHKLFTQQNQMEDSAQENDAGIIRHSVIMFKQAEQNIDKDFQRNKNRNIEIKELPKVPELVSDSVQNSIKKSEDQISESTKTASSSSQEQKTSVQDPPNIPSPNHDKATDVEAVVSTNNNRFVHEKKIVSFLYQTLQYIQYSQTALFAVIHVPDTIVNSMNNMILLLARKLYLLLDTCVRETLAKNNIFNLEFFKEWTATPNYNKAISTLQSDRTSYLRLLNQIAKKMNDKFEPTSKNPTKQLASKITSMNEPEVSQQYKAELKFFLQWFVMNKRLQGVKSHEKVTHSHAVSCMILCDNIRENFPFTAKSQIRFDWPMFNRLIGSFEDQTGIIDKAIDVYDVDEFEVIE